MKKLPKSQRFTSTDEVKEDLSELLSTQVEQLGYIVPGHGLKGRQQSLLSSEDLDQMYQDYNN